jgi:SAM-dependent methyltransferase
LSATGRIKVLSEPLAPPSGCEYPEGTTLRAVTRTKRAKGDFYETPAWCVEEILPFLPLEGAGLVLDAGAGTGAISAAIAAKFPNLEILGVEKNPELVAQARARGLYSAEFHEGDFERDTFDAPDVIVMNPPYSRALEFFQRALAVVKRGGTVAVLLRAAFASGKGRREFHAKHPLDLHFLARRPSFTGGGTDATEYAWFVSGPGRGGRWFVLPCHRPVKGKAKRARRVQPKAAKAGRRGLAQERGTRESAALPALPAVQDGPCA